MKKTYRIEIVVKPIKRRGHEGSPDFGLGPGILAFTEVRTDAPLGVYSWEIVELANRLRDAVTQVNIYEIIKQQPA